MKQIKINTGSSFTIFTHKKKNGVIRIDVECTNVDDYPYNYPTIDTAMRDYYKMQYEKLFLINMKLK